MATVMTAGDMQRIAHGYDERPERSFSLQAEAYTDPRWLTFEQQAIFSHTWQWVCHVEKLREPGAYVTVEVAGRPICVVRDKGGTLRAFYNVCKHRAHEASKGRRSNGRHSLPLSRLVLQSRRPAYPCTRDQVPSAIRPGEHLPSIRSRSRNSAASSTSISAADRRWPNKRETSAAKS